MTALLEQMRAVAAKRPDGPAGRPVPVSGLLAAAGSLGVGVAALTMLTLIGWIASPRGALGDGLPGVFRTAAQLWLAAHHAGFDIAGGKVGLLPLGAIALPVLLLYRAAVWMARDAQLARPKTRREQLQVVVQAGISLAAPYSLMAGFLALLARNDVTQPSVAQALVSHLVIAFGAGAVATARSIGPLGSVLRLLPERARSLVVGTATATTVLLVAGVVLMLIALVPSLGQAKELTDALAPGVVGGALLLLVQVLYLPNAVIWGTAYAVGPGFAVGADTIVAPTGVRLGPVPSLPLLAGLPESGPAPAVLMVAVAVPFVAGIAGGIRMIRIAPTPAPEVASLWGFACGLATGLIAGLLAGLSGGPIGGGRLAEVGPSSWQVTLATTLEVGVAAAIAAGAANWFFLRGPTRRARGRRRPETFQQREARFAAFFAVAEAETQEIPVVVDQPDDGHVIYVDPTPPWER